jgi:hypothetical protein
MKPKVWRVATVAIASGCIVSAAAQTSSTQVDSTSGNTITVTGCLEKGNAGGVRTSGSSAGTTAADSSTTPRGSTSGAAYILTNATMANTGASSRGSSSDTTAGTPNTGTAAGASSGRSGSGSATATTGNTTGGTAASGQGASSRSTSGVGTAYILEGHETELNKHQGHRIEVTGATTSMPASGSNPKSSTTTSGPDSSTPRSTSNAGDGNPAGSGSERSGNTASAPQHIRVSSIRMVSNTCSGSGR